MGYWDGFFNQVALGHSQGDPQCCPGPGSIRAPRTSGTTNNFRINSGMGLKY